MVNSLVISDVCYSVIPPNWLIKWVLDIKKKFMKEKYKDKEQTNRGIYVVNVFNEELSYKWHSCL